MCIVRSDTVDYGLLYNGKLSNVGIFAKRKYFRGTRRHHENVQADSSSQKLWWR